MKHSLVSEILGQSNIYLPDLEKFWDTEVPEVAGSYLEKAELGAGWSRYMVRQGGRKTVGTNSKIFLQSRNV